MRRIALFYKSFSLSGGQERFVYNFAHFLADRGWKVRVISSKVKEKPKNESIEVQKISVPNLGRGLRNLIFALMCKKIGKELKKDGYILFGFGKTYYQDIYRSGGGIHRFYVNRAQYKFESELSRKLYILKKKTSLSYHITNFIEKLTFENENLKTIVAPTEFVKSQIGENFKPKAQIKIIRNGVNLKRFNPERRNELREKFREELGIDKNDFVIGYVSSNFRLKGFQYLLEAISKLKSEGFSFKLLAAGEEFKRWKKEIERLNLKGNVFIIGKVKEVERVYFSSDLFVYPTLYDASANVVLEAMASGLPVLASRYSGTGELLPTRFIIENPEKPEDIFQKVRTVLSKNRKDLEDEGYRNYKIVSKFPQEEVFGKYEELIKEIT